MYARVGAAAARRTLFDWKWGPGPKSSDALKLKLCSLGCIDVVLQSKPLMQTQSSCGAEPLNSWAASLEPWLASFPYLVLEGRCLR